MILVLLIFNGFLTVKSIDIDIYVSGSFNDSWNPSFVFSAAYRNIYFKTYTNNLDFYFANRTEFKLKEANWHYMREGCINQAFSLRLAYNSQSVNPDPPSAVRNVMMVLYPETTNIFVKQNVILNRELQMYRIRLICTFPYEWHADYDNISSVNSQLFIKNVDIKLKNAFQQIFLLNYLTLELLKFMQGSVITDMYVIAGEINIPLYDYQVTDSIYTVFLIAFGNSVTINTISNIQYGTKTSVMNVTVTPNQFDTKVIWLVTAVIMFTIVFIFILVMSLKKWRQCSWSSKINNNSNLSYDNDGIEIDYNPPCKNHIKRSFPKIPKIPSGPNVSNTDNMWDDYIISRC